MTIRELIHEFALFVDREHDARNRDVTLAWTIANLSRAERLPSLSRLLTRRVRTQTVAQKRIALDMIFGPGKGRKVVH